METTKKTFKVQNGQKIHIAPICDLQYTGSAGAMASHLFQEYLNEAQSLGAYYIGLGDYVDFMSPSNRARLNNAALYDTAMDVIQQKALSLVKDLYTHYLGRTQGQWLGLVHGHHWSPISSTETTDTWLAKQLGCPYLGTCAYVVLDFVSDDDSQRQGRVVLWLHHGQGNGRASAPINKLERVFAYWDADVFVIGHMSKLASAAVNRIYPVDRPDDGNITLKDRKSLLVGAGSWSRAYMQGHKKNGIPHGCYVEEAMMDPAALGGAMVQITSRWISRRWAPIIKAVI